MANIDKLAGHLRDKTIEEDKLFNKEALGKGYAKIITEKSIDCALSKAGKEKKEIDFFALL